MKKTASLILAILLIATMFCGCTAKEESDGLTVKSGVLTVAISPDFSPMEFVDTSKSGQDQYVGFDVSLAKYIAEQLDLELEIKPMDFGACQAAVQTGKVDMSISGYSWTEERAENFNLSDPYYANDEEGANESEQAIIVLKENEGKYTTAEDFAGLKVGAQTQSLQMNMCQNQLPDTVEIVEVTDLGTAVEMLRNGKIDALAVAKGNGDAIISQNDSVAFSGFLFEVSESEENNVILLKKGADELTAKVNEILAEVHSTGLDTQWYREAKELAGIETAAEISYDEEGQKIE